MKVFFDGGSRGREGRMEIAVVAGGACTIRDDLGTGTSGEAEWLALIHAAEEVARRDLRHAVLLGDSADVVAKAAGRRPGRGEDARHLSRFRAIIGDRAVTIRRIRRTQNLAGIALARRHPR